MLVDRYSEYPRLIQPIPSHNRHKPRVTITYTNSHNPECVQHKKITTPLNDGVAEKRRERIFENGRSLVLNFPHSTRVIQYRSKSKPSLIAESNGNAGMKTKHHRIFSPPQSNKTLKIEIQNEKTVNQQNESLDNSQSAVNKSFEQAHLEAKLTTLAKKVQTQIEAQPVKKQVEVAKQEKLIPIHLILIISSLLLLLIAIIK